MSSTGFRLASAIVLSAGMSLLTTVSAQDDIKSKVEQRAQLIAQELAQFCPAADPGDQKAFDKCRNSLFNQSQFRSSLPDFVLWGRQRNVNTTLKDSKLTQFAPDVFSGLYASLFMFNGKHTVEFVPRENLYLIRFQTGFRNRLEPGQFPYPFWHEDDKWATYENAKEFMLWWDPKADKVKVAQFTALGTGTPIVKLDQVKHAFDGKWLWTDKAGLTQPMVTVFDGLYRADNPHIKQLDIAYKSLALKLRDGQCFECHVPNNPDGMKKLVLLQTPAHAAAEIKRVLKSVREDTMPKDEFGIEQPLAKAQKNALLLEGERFESLVEAARKWEQINATEKLTSNMSK
jgi:hypothetical protein